MKTKLDSDRQYWPHVDGLRAIAVLSVIFFHLDIEFFSGGFVGVDVFFVLSGFLISSIIWRELKENGRFSFARFYIRRARRLLPSLFSTILITFIIGLSLYSSERLLELGEEILYALFSVSNFLYWQQSGYFDGSSETKTLLHMWSLSVEEQFYLVWPITLVVGYKLFRSSGQLLLLLGVFLLSLILSVVLLTNEIAWFPNQEQAAFYWAPFRAYEFIIGASGYFLVDKVSNRRWVIEFVFIASAVALIYSVVAFDNQMKFPYFYALLPCVATLGLILARGSVLSRILLENAPMIFIGLISYTLYLVHWPTIVFYQYLRFGSLSPADVFVALGIMMSISLLIYYAVETPLRKNFTIESATGTKIPKSNKRFLMGVAWFFVLYIFVGGSLIFTSGLSAYKEELFSAEEIKAGKTMRYDRIKQACLIENQNADNCGSSKNTQVLIFGNSLEPDGYNITEQIVDREKTNLILFGGTNFCNIEIDDFGVVSSKSQKYGCDERTAVFNDNRFIRSLDIIVYSSNIPFAPNKVPDWALFRHLKTINPELKFVVIGSYFNTRLECAEISNHFDDTGACASLEQISYAGNEEVEYGRKEGLADGLDFLYLDKFKALCSDVSNFDTCLTRTKTEPMFYDQLHMSLSFSQLLGRRLLGLYRPQLEQVGLVHNSDR